VASATRLNAGASYANFIVLALVGFIVNPLLLGFLGSSTFGAWTAARRYLDFASVADGRATQALKWFVSFRLGNSSDSATLKRGVGASLMVWLLWLPIVAVASAAAVLALPLVIRGVESSELPALTWVGAILAANVVLGGLLTIPDAVLVGANQGYRSMTVTTVIIVLSNVAMVWAVASGHGIVALAVVILIAAVANGAITWLVARRRISWWGAQRPTRSDVTTLARFSGWVLGWALVTKLYLSTEIILLGAFVGTVSVASYTFTSYIPQFALSICLMTTSAFMPRVGALLGANKKVQAAGVANEVKLINLAIATVAGCAILLLNSSFVTLWVGSEHFMGPTVNALMVMALVQLATIRSDAQIQDTGLNIRTKVIVGGVGALLGIAIPGVLFAMSGDIALLFAGIVVGRLVVSVVFPFLVRSLIPGARFGVRAHIVAIGMLGASYAVGLAVHIGNFALLAVAGVAAIGLLGGLAYGLILPSSTRSKLIAFRRRANPKDGG